MSAVERLNEALSDRYHIERELGQGGMATVYLADDLKHERKVAIKVLRPELAAVVGAERFLAEIKTTANLQHPHILPLHDSGEADGFLFYVMPYVQGESLRDKLEKEKQLRVDDALELTRKVADALDYAHGKGVVHRDIKPANILLSERGEPLVADFGIALAVSQAGGGRITETGLSLGTPHYMSPEQATGDRDVDPRSDVYALGCVLYEMLAGQPPFAAPTAQAVLARILTEDARRVTELRRTVPPHVGAVVQRALEKLPADRFESAEEFVEALDDTSFTYETVAAAAVPPPLPVEPPTRRRWLVPALAAALVVTTGVALAGLAGAFDDGASARGAGPAVRTIMDLGDVTVQPSALYEVVISPDGSRFAIKAEVEGGRAVFQRTAEDLTFRRIPGTEHTGAGNLRFSPDGEWIAYADDERLMKVSVLGGQPTPVVPAGDLRPRLLDWSVEGWIVFWAGDPDGNGLYRVPDTGGTPERLTGSPQWATFNPQLLPDGSGVLFSDRGSESVALYEFESDSVRVLIPRGIDAGYVESGHIVYLDEADGLWAVPFDLDTRTVDGDAKPVLQGVASDGFWGRYAVSRDGTLVFGQGGVTPGGGAPSELVVVGLDGTVTPLNLPARTMFRARWAPDGRTVAYAGRTPTQTTDSTDIYLYDTELGNTPRRLTNVGLNNEPHWSPDGTRVAFTSERDGSDGPDLFVRDVNTDRPPRLLLTLPDGQWITDWPEEDLLVIESGQQSGIFLVDIGGDSAVVTQYYRPDADVDDMVVSPDGALAAYGSDESGQDEIYIRSFPDPRAETVVSEGGGRWPFWSPDGATLYYQCEDNLSLCAAEIATEPTAVVTSRRVVMEWPYGFGPDLHPDGDRLLARRQARAATDDGTDEIEPARHIVVHNWFGELRRIFGEGGG